MTASANLVFVPQSCRELHADVEHVSGARLAVADYDDIPFVREHYEPDSFDGNVRKACAELVENELFDLGFFGDFLHSVLRNAGGVRILS